MNSFLLAVMMIGFVGFLAYLAYDTCVRYKKASEARRVTTRISTGLSLAQVILRA